MPELPEIASRAKEMNENLPGKKITFIEILQSKCLNLSIDDFREVLEGAVIQSVTYHGKWIKVLTTQGWLLINMGMGGEILLTCREKMPAKYRLVFDFSDSTCLTINFWWFGYVYYAETDKLFDIPMIARLGPNFLDLSMIQFASIIQTQKGKARIKSVLLDQSKMAGIGNAYIHDILFFACLHPNRLVTSLSETEIKELYLSIKKGLLPSLEKGGAFYEVNIFGNKGGFAMEDIVVGYRDGSPCPNCGTIIEKIRTGSTNSYICPVCQSMME